MTRPETPYEAASYDLNKFRERRMTDRRFTARGTIDRRTAPVESKAGADENSSVADSQSDSQSKPD